MRFRLKSLDLLLKRGQEVITFDDISYFWGQMGAGKTSIARLVDYCLGGGIELSPAMQSEFVGARLTVALAKAVLELERARESDRIIASWTSDDGSYRVNIPARDADGEVIVGTGVENLSDLIFWLSDVIPPRVRKSRVNQDSSTARLSIRDLLWYCYLDQDNIDSSFFHLEEGGHTFKRYKSRDVVRFVVGFHNEQVAQIEATLDQLRGERLALSSTIAGLTRALKEVGVDSEIQLSGRVEELRARAAALQIEIASTRDSPNQNQTTHAIEELRTRARQLDDELARIDTAIRDLEESQDRDLRHMNELETLSFKYRRSMSAKAVLSGVVFSSCPRCTLNLPERAAGSCTVCGQLDRSEPVDSQEATLIEKDVKARSAELKEVLEKHEAALTRLRRERDALRPRKARIERERNEAAEQYDSAYLSMMLARERERASILQEADNLTSLLRLPQILEHERERLADIQSREAKLRAEMLEARTKAESDATNLEQLKAYFLDCLVRAGIPGISSTDRVEIPTTDFFPLVHGSTTGESSVTSFANVSSGGKKTLFKCCFAIALHRLAADLDAPLPKLLIIDSPMKNISERENRDQFEGFYRMLYELAEDELAETQLVLIDKEFSPPAAGSELKIVSRQMRPSDPEHPPLIPYYYGA